MGELNLSRLHDLVTYKQGNRGIRAVARESGVSAAPLSRLRRGYVPSLLTFVRLCCWLKTDPGWVLEVGPCPGKERREK